MTKSRCLSGFQDNRQQDYCHQGYEIATPHPESRTGNKLSIIYSHLRLWVLIPNILIHPCNAATPIKPMNYPEQLQSRLSAALEAKGADYQARTHHLKDGQPIFTNRLILEDSPYLLQHAHNPVNWYPWGRDAFAQARLENKPVFLSIGYATCHWCHVMEEESFESTAIAKILNDNFIAIKVDREQYPDIDQTYMTAVTMLTGHGGWPMSSFLTPEGKPFFGGTYFPPASFTDLLLQVDKAWKTQQQTLVQQADKLAQAVQHATSIQEQISTLELSAVQSAVDNILSNYDTLNGGFGQAPKFPNEPLLLLLLQVGQRNPNENLTAPLNHTLSIMAQGGMYDQLGGGFHRYATDSHWLVPHFEKMLYNQAYLARVYAHAYQLTGDPLYARITRQTLDYVLREMTTANGVFYSATDADSEGHEGSYFIWTEGEIKTLLKPEDARFIIKLFGITQQGNFEGKNILYLPESLDEFARHQDMTLDQLFLKLDPLLEALREHRKKRIPPLTDDKIIVAWNGMLITALAEAGDLLQEPRYIEAAERAADALWQTQRTEDGKLWRINLNGKASIPARQDDYVHFSEALLTLYDVDGNPARLEQARVLCDEMLDKFLDSASGTLLMGRDELLFTQPKDAYDSALPSGNAVAVRVLSRLAKRTGDLAYSDRAAKILQAFSGDIIKHPAGYAYMLAQLDEIKNGELGSRQYASLGAVKINATLNQQHNLSVNMDIAEGWHVNAHQPLQESLIATEISLENNNYWHLESVSYPKPALETLRFEKQPLALYQSKVQIQAKLRKISKSNHSPVHVNLKLQTCNQESCLPPETISLDVFERPYSK